MRIVLTYLLAFLLPFNVNADDGKLSMEEKQDTVNKVFKKLLNGMGYAPAHSALKVELTEKDRLAEFDTTNNTIFIGVECINQLHTKKILKEGLAFIIGHELGHYQLRNNHLIDISAVDIDATKKIYLEYCSIESKVEETYCDYYGAFSAYRANYEVEDALGIILSLRDTTETATHPSSATRLKNLEKFKQEVKRLRTLFETANRLSIIGAYDEAQACYEAIYKVFPSREILNNQAVAILLSALKAKSTNGAYHLSQYPLPIELDPETRLKNGVRGKFILSEAQKIEANIESAIVLLEKINSKDAQSYPILYINLACAFILKEDYQNARINAQKALDIAIKYNDKKIQKDAQYLLPLINNQFSESPNPNFQKTQLSLENFVGADSLNDIEIDQVNLYDVTIQPEIKILSKPFVIHQQNHSCSSLIQVGKNILLQIPDTNHPKIPIGLDITKFTQQYPKPKKIIQSKLGQYLVYEEQDLVIEIKNDTVVDFFLYTR